MWRSRKRTRCLVLVSLPASLDHVVTTLLSGKDTLKHDELIAALLMNESRRKSCSDGLSKEGSALISTCGRGRSVG